MENNRQERIQAFAFVLVLFAALSISTFFSLRNNQVSKTDTVLQLDNRVNPNEASLGSLVRLSGIGLARAQAIITYRESLENSREKPFNNSRDLQKIKGIGPKTAENINGLLRFE